MVWFVDKEISVPWRTRRFADDCDRTRMSVFFGCFAVTLLNAMYRRAGPRDVRSFPTSFTRSGSLGAITHPRRRRREPYFPVMSDTVLGSTRARPGHPNIVRVHHGMACLLVVCMTLSVAALYSSPPDWGVQLTYYLRSRNGKSWSIY